MKRFLKDLLIALLTIIIIYFLIIFGITDWLISIGVALIIFYKTIGNKFKNKEEKIKKIIKSRYPTIEPIFEEILEKINNITENLKKEIKEIKKIIFNELNKNKPL